MPPASMMKPDPSELTRRGPWFGGSPCPRRLKKSLNSSSSCGSFGSCGIGELRVSTFCEVEMLTTASITFSATSAMLSGPRAQPGADKTGRTIAPAAMEPKTGRRNRRAYWASDMDDSSWGDDDALARPRHGRKDDLY